MANKWVGYKTQLLDKRPTKRRLLFACALCALFVVAVIVALVLTSGQDNPDAARNCTEANSKIATSRSGAGSPQDFADTYKTIDANNGACKSGTSILGLGGGSTENKLEKLKYYHMKATVGYSIGKTEEAKQAAKKGLDIDKSLDASDKKLENYSQLIQDLKWVQEGTY